MDWDQAHEMGDHYLTRDSIWTTALRQRIAVRDLENDHLLNIIKCFRNKSPHGTQVWPLDPIRRRDWLNLLANEAYSRGLTLEEPDEQDPVHE